MARNFNIGDLLKVISGGARAGVNTHFANQQNQYKHEFDVYDLQRREEEREYQRGRDDIADDRYNRGAIADQFFRVHEGAAEAMKPAKPPGSIESLWASRVASGEASMDEYLEYKRNLAEYTRSPGKKRPPNLGSLKVISDTETEQEDGDRSPVYPMRMTNRQYQTHNYTPYDKQPGSGPTAFQLPGAGRQLDPNIGALREKIKAELAQDPGWKDLTPQEKELVIQDEMRMRKRQ